MDPEVKYLRNTRNVFFVGAGISANPPTYFPTAIALSSKLLAAISPDEETLPMLLELADSARPTKRSRGDYIRFELLLEILQELIDPQLALLTFTGSFNRPNALHYFLAKRALAGDIVITTNFDGLIEKAIRNLGGKPLSICTSADFQSGREVLASQRTPVYKIHGSYERYDGSETKTSLESVQATLAALTASAPDLLLPEPKRSFLITATHNRPLIVAGYSGTDDLDIMPTFSLLTPASLLWLDHQSSGDPYEATQQRKQLWSDQPDSQLTSKESFLKAQLTSSRYPLTIYEVNTPGFFTEAFGAGQLENDDEEAARLKFAAFIDVWASTHLGRVRKKFEIVGQILFRLSRFQKAYEYYLKASALCDASDPSEDQAETAKMCSRIATELGLFTEAEDWAKKSMANLSVLENPKGAARSFHQYGWTQFKLDKFDEALDWYERAGEICRKHKLNTVLSYVIHDSALIYQERSLFHEAIALYRESLSLSEEEGDIRHVMYSYHQLGTVNYDLGLFVESKEFHLKALQIATLVGDYSQEDNSEHELGLIDFISGEICSSIRRFRRGIHIARLTGRLEFIPMDLQHIGVAFMEAGRYKAARKFLEQAKEKYIAVKDHSTIPELQSYVVQSYLLDGKPDEAFAAAKVAQQLSSERGIGEYLCRANFMMGLAEYTIGDQLAGGAKICDAVLTAQDSSFLALMLDQIYLCARLDVTGLPCPSIIGAASKAVAIYSQLGNSNRLQWTERFVRNLDKNHSTDLGGP